MADRGRLGDYDVDVVGGGLMPKPSFSTVTWSGRREVDVNKLYRLKCREEGMAKKNQAAISQPPEPNWAGFDQTRVASVQQRRPGAVTVQEYAAHYHISRATAQHTLKDLFDSGQAGRERWRGQMVYWINEKS